MKVKKTINWVRDKFSYSKLSCFARCPRLAFYRYVVKLKPPPQDFLLMGRGTHAGQEHDNRERVKGRRPGKKEVLDAAVTAYEEEGGEQTDTFAEQHRAQLDAFWASGERDRIQPLPNTIEAPFELDLFCTADPDNEPRKLATIQGFVDVCSDEGETVVVDYKTVGRPVSDSDAEESMQADLYMLGAGAGDEAVGAKFVSFVKYKKQKSSTKVSKTVYLDEYKRQKLLRFLNDTITSFRKNLKSGDFPKCDPQCWWCSPTACECYGHCYPDKDPNLGKYVSVEEVRKVGTMPQPDWRKKK